MKNFLALSLLDFVCIMLINVKCQQFRAQLSWAWKKFYNLGASPLFLGKLIAQLEWTPKTAGMMTKQGPNIKSPHPMGVTTNNEYKTTESPPWKGQKPRPMLLQIKVDLHVQCNEHIA